MKAGVTRGPGVARRGRMSREGREAMNRSCAVWLIAVVLLAGWRTGPVLAQTPPEPGEKAKTLAELIKELRDKDPEVRAMAALAIGEQDRPARAAVRPLIRALKDPDRFVRWSAACSLGKIGPAARAAVPA